MSPAGGGGQFGGVMRSLRRDDSVTQVRVTKGRPGGCSSSPRPYRTVVLVFLVLSSSTRSSACSIPSSTGRSSPGSPITGPI